MLDSLHFWLNAHRTVQLLDTVWSLSCWSHRSPVWQPAATGRSTNEKGGRGGGAQTLGKSATVQRWAVICVFWEGGGHADFWVLIGSPVLNSCMGLQGAFHPSKRALCACTRRENHSKIAALPKRIASGQGQASSNGKKWNSWRAVNTPVFPFCNNMPFEAGQWGSCLILLSYWSPKYTDR